MSLRLQNEDTLDTLLDYLVNIGYNDILNFAF